MKTITLVSAIFLLVIAAGSCKEKSDTTPEAPQVTFPACYCGDFTFTVVTTTNWEGGSAIDTAVWSGQISQVSGTVNKLEVRYGAGSNFVVCNGDSIWGSAILPMVSEAGGLSYPEANGCGANKPFSGTFEGHDEIRFTMATGGLGAWTEQVVLGVRKR